MRNLFTPSIENLPSVIPLFPLSGAVVLPHGQLPLNIFEPRYLNMAFDALSGTRLIGMVQPMEDSTDDMPVLHQTGCAGRIISFSETRDSRLLIVLGGISRFDIEKELKLCHKYRRAEVSWRRFVHDIEDRKINFNRDRLLACAKAYVDHCELLLEWDSLTNLEFPELIDTLASILPFSPHEKQGFVESPVLQDRCELLTALCEFAVDQGFQGGNRTH